MTQTGPKRIDLPPEAYELNQGWPGTIPVRRMKKAQENGKKLEEKDWNWQEELNSEEKIDLANLIRLSQISQYSDECMDEMMREIDPADEDEAQKRLFQYALEGDTEETIGIYFQLKLGNTTKTGQNIVSVGASKMLRDPEWMGTAQIFPMVKDRTVCIAESKERAGRPGVMILSHNLSEMTTHPGSTDFPKGEAQRIDEIARWHGARESWWLPLDELTNMRL